MGERWGPGPLWWERAVLFIFSAIFLSFLRTLSLKLSMCVSRSSAFNVCGSFPLFSIATSIFFTQRVCGPLVSTGVNKTNFARPRPICSKTKTADLKTKTLCSKTKTNTNTADLKTKTKTLCSKTKIADLKTKTTVEHSELSCQPKARPFHSR